MVIVDKIIVNNGRGFMKHLVKRVSFVFLTAIFIYNIIMTIFYIRIIAKVEKYENVISLYSSEAQRGLINLKGDPGNSYNPKYTGGNELETRLGDSVVALYMLGDGHSGTCSGTIIDEIKGNHIVLTAKHCVGRTDEMYVDNNLVKLVISSTVQDLTILIVDGLVEDKYPIRIAENNAQILDVIHHVGFPSGEYYISSGYVRRFNKGDHEANLMGVPGCSGGGIFNNDGELVGVLWGGKKSHKNFITLYEPVTKIREFLNQVKVYLNV